jgi:hypothetical protein
MAQKSDAALKKIFTIVLNPILALPHQFDSHRNVEGMAF